MISKLNFRWSNIQNYFESIIFYKMFSLYARYRKKENIQYYYM